MVQVSNICKSYGGHLVIENFTHLFPDDGITMITGPSGVGKTTLLQIILGLTMPDSGSIDGVKGKSLSAIFQEDRLFEHLSAVKNIELVLRPQEDIRREIQNHLSQVGLDGFWERRVRELSGGMKRRVAIVRAVMCRAQVLVMDEPLRGLDRQTKETVIAYLRQYLPGRTSIVVSHDPEEGEKLDVCGQVKM